MSQYSIDKIHNFSIIAHIDHGKSTLADRLLEEAMSYEIKSKGKERLLDTLELEQEKGITIKLQATTMQWKGHTLNLIDTPGHVDFSYEVSRSLAACESALLLIDAQQGVQAQTLSNTRKALDLGLTIIPVLNKIDLPGANIPAREKELKEIFDINPEEIHHVSAKTGEGVLELLDAIIELTPTPSGDENKPLKALIFDSFYDEHKGVIVSVRVFDGTLGSDKRKIGNSHDFIDLNLLRKEEVFKPTEIGQFAPELVEKASLKAGEVGYIATGMKDISYFTVGDTISDTVEIEPLPGYVRPKPNVYASFFPIDPEEYENLKIGLQKLSLSDAALVFSGQRSNLLGSGFRCGFLGLLHMEIIQERLEREHGQSLIITAPTVEYKIIQVDGTELFIQTPQDMPDINLVEEIHEPIVRVKMLCPHSYMGVMMDLCQSRRGSYVNTTYINQGADLKLQYMIIEYDMPLASLVSNFFDQMKNLSNGYASMEYEFIDFFPVDIVKVSILVNKEEVPALSFLETRESARSKAIKILEVMKEEIPRQQFQVPIQAAIGAKIIARENVKALRKDVTAKLYGGDYSRKKKLLEKQKKGKKRLKQIGRVNIPQSAFLAILKT